ncbi:Aquaporin TIP5-1 [Platanthera guangdongensis]|uniref:Aquaporin TIP5-1 n=1 Tax=Platanthera guangdongensis TaxID=2320717 RepID=A0ABR2LMW4_9ASPA
MGRTLLAIWPEYLLSSDKWSSSRCGEQLRKMQAALDLDDLCDFPKPGSEIPVPSRCNHRRPQENETGELENRNIFSLFACTYSQIKTHDGIMSLTVEWTFVVRDPALAGSGYRQPTGVSRRANPSPFPPAGQEAASRGRVARPALPVAPTGRGAPFSRQNTAQARDTNNMAPGKVRDHIDFFSEEGKGDGLANLNSNAKQSKRNLQSRKFLEKNTERKPCFSPAGLRSYLAEFISTFLFVFVAVGSAISASQYSYFSIYN